MYLFQDTCILFQKYEICIMYSVDPLSFHVNKRMTLRRVHTSAEA